MQTVQFPSNNSRSNTPSPSLRCPTPPLLKKPYAFSLHNYIELYKYDFLQIYPFAEHYGHVIQINQAYFEQKLMGTHWAEFPLDAYPFMYEHRLTLIHLTQKGIYLMNVQPSFAQGFEWSLSIIDCYLPKFMLYAVQQHIKDFPDLCVYVCCSKEKFAHNFNAESVHLNDYTVFDCNQYYKKETGFVFLDKFLIHTKDLVYCKFFSRDFFKNSPDYVLKSLYSLVQHV